MAVKMCRVTIWGKMETSLQGYLGLGWVWLGTTIMLI